MNLRTVALAALALLATPIAHRVARELRAVHTVGEVTALDRHGEDDEPTYTPEITYTTAGGTRAVMHGVSCSPPLYAVGEQLDIIYDGDDAAFGSPLARWWPWALAVATCLAVCFQVRIPPRMRPQLFGIAIVAGLVVVGASERAQARGAIGVAATALAALAVIACRRCTDECRCDDASLPRAQIARDIGMKRRSSAIPATFS